MSSAIDFLGFAMAQVGDPYAWGAEAEQSNPNPPRFDCSELVQWAANRVGVSPAMPDGSWVQARHCRQRGTLVPVERALVTAGALLFKFSSSPWSGGRPSGAHIAISRGDGRTIEAHSTRYGVGTFSTRGRGWTHAGLVPGLTYQMTPVPALPPKGYTMAVTVQMPVIRRGATGADVSKAQALINVLTGRGLVVDGDFGPATSAAVEDVQRFLKMSPVDGVIGPATWRVLIELP